MVNLYQIKQIRQLEQIAMQQCGLHEAELMQRAGVAGFAYLRARYPQATRISVYCGTGNNGGDGYVLARAAQQHGLDVEIRQVGDPSRASLIAKAAFAQCNALAIPVRDALHVTDFVPQVIVDALLGIGACGEISGVLRDVIASLQQNDAPILALDIPSGLHADTGQVLGCAIKADATITFIGWKLGLVLGQAAEQVGHYIACDDLGLPALAFAQVTPVATTLGASEQMDVRLPKRARTAHKGDFGHVLVVGSDQGMSGAVRMAAEASARVGAGLVSVGTHPAHYVQVNQGRPELMCHGLVAPAQCASLLARATVLVLGPGLGQSAWSQMMWHTFLTQARIPLVLDADGLNCLASQPCRRDDWLLTPHPGEAARLLGVSTRQVQADRLASAHAIQAAYGGVIVLKGAGTVIVGNNATAYVCCAGNPGMASGGMGDVLSGVLGGLLAQGLSLLDAARLGVHLHAKAADRAAAALGERGLLATDLLLPIQCLVNA